jgi:iron complex outermembrane receptor protein
MRAHHLSTAALVAILADPASAQDAAPAPQGVEEIIVTAERREANLQDVPIAVTALTQETLEAQGVRGVIDIAASAPNLTATTGPQGSADANFFVRGVGQFDFIATNDPGVGVYVDGVYLGRTVGALLDAGDVGRVEVLRGPQGTLFGRNTLGGAVSVTSVAPELGELGARGRIAVGSRDRFDADAGVNLPLGETAALRVYGFTRYQDGFAINAISDARFGAIERAGGKVQLLWKPTEALSITVMGDYVDDSSNPAPSVLMAIAPFPFFPAGAAAQVQDRSRFYRNFASNLPFSENEIWGVSGTIAYDFGGVTLKSISAYRSLDALSTSDPDGTTFRIYDQRSPTEQTQFSQELQLTGDSFDNRLNWVAGVYFFREEVEQTLFLCFAPITPLSVYTGFFNACNTWNQGNDQETRSFAVFGQGRVALSDQLSVTLGGRWTREKKEIVSNQAFDFRPAGFSPAPGVVVPGFLAPIVSNLEDSAKFSRFTPKVGAEWKPNDDVLVFASWARGFRSGGFNGRLIAPNTQVPTYDPDTTDAFELGLKSDLMDRRLRLNLTAFHTSYKDIQQTISDPAIQFRVANAGEARIFGVEAEAALVPVDGLRLDAALGYSSSEFRDVPASVGPINGNALPFSPKWTVYLAGEYRVDFGRFAATPRIDWRYQSRTFFTAFNNQYGVPDDGLQEQQAGYGLLSARLTFADADDRFSVAVFGQNLTDEEYYTFGQNALGVQGVSYNYLGRPREWGVTFGARF